MRTGILTSFAFLMTLCVAFLAHQKWIIPAPEVAPIIYMQRPPVQEQPIYMQPIYVQPYGGHGHHR